MYICTYVCICMYMYMYVYVCVCDIVTAPTKPLGTLQKLNLSASSSLLPPLPRFFVPEGARESDREGESVCVR